MSCCCEISPKQIGDFATFKLIGLTALGQFIHAHIRVADQLGRGGAHALEAGFVAVEHQDQRSICANEDVRLFVAERRTKNGDGVGQPNLVEVEDGKGALHDDQRSIRWRLQRERQAVNDLAFAEAVRPPVTWAALLRVVVVTRPTPQIGEESSIALFQQPFPCPLN